MTKTPISQLGEFGLIQHLTKNIEMHNVSTLVGIGDDAAVFDHYGKQTIMTTDMLVEDVHFDLVYTPLKHLGYKSVVVNISDICAMGAIPTHITIGLSISSKYTIEALTELYEGIYAACNHYKVDFVGGDTCSSIKGLTIAGTAIGEATPNTFVKRSGAKEGDLICVTGDLGAAYIGLVIMEREKKVFLEHPDVKPELEEDTYVIRRLLRPEARCDIIAQLAERQITPTSMIDISDGLSSELLHICQQSQVGCLVFEEKMPIAEQTRQSAFKFTLDPTMCALHGGEDYELLFTIDPKDEEIIKASPDISIIGEVLDSTREMKLQTKANNTYPLTAQGWAAFRESKS